jgi:biopolymer transport protein ExbD
MHGRDETNERRRGAGRWRGPVRSAPKPKLQPPLTPMIDVTFQLVIFFLLTMTFRAQEGQIPGSLPRVGGIAAGEQVPLEPLVIEISPLGPNRSMCRYEVTGQAALLSSPDELHEALRARRQEIGQDEPVILRPAANVPWRFVVEAFNQAVRAEYTSIGYAAT